MVPGMIELKMKVEIQLKPKIDLPLHKNLRSLVQHFDRRSL